MAIRTMLDRIQTEFPQARTEEITDHPLATFVRRVSPEEIKNALGEDAIGLTFKGSVGQGIWANVPWVAIFDPSVTTTATKGYYVVYLFHAQQPMIHLSLNQATTEALEEFGSGAFDVLQDRATFIRKRMHDFSKQLPEVAIDLGSQATLPAGYEAGHALGVTYTGQLPAEEVLIGDLRLAVRAYRALIFRGGLDATPVDGDRDAGHLVERRQYRMHKRIERNRKARDMAKRHHGTRCQVCTLEFSERYGPIGDGFIEVHHLKPISSLREGEPVNYSVADDFAVLCANCHRMVHRQDDPADLTGLRGCLKST